MLITIISHNICIPYFSGLKSNIYILQGSILIQINFVKLKQNIS
jgi:hypothetical protein